MSRADLDYTNHPFTVAICMACGSDAAVMPKLRDVVRNCPHGMLVATQCLLGEFTCATVGSGQGAMVLLQPCTPQRVPTASVQWIGPIRTEADADAACRWIAAGEWSRATVPLSLRADLHLTRASRNN